MTRKPSKLWRTFGPSRTEMMPLGAVGQFLSARPQDKRAVSPQIELHVEERLVQVEFVLVSRSRPTPAAVLQAALELAEQTDVLAHVEVAMEEIALEEIAVVLRVLPPVGVIEVFVPLPRLTAEGEIPAARRR